MKKEAILKTTVTYWSDEDECYVTESSLFDRVIGTGDSESEADKMFEEMLEEAYEYVEKDRVAGYTKGRPAKGGVEFHAQIRPETKTDLALLAKDLGISQGEAVDYLLFFHDKRRHENSEASVTLNLKTMPELLTALHKAFETTKRKQEKRNRKKRAV